MQCVPRINKYCCVPGCTDITSSRHRFPKGELDVFNVWVNRINHPRFKNLQPEQIYKTYVVCDRHFTEDNKVRGSKKLIHRVLPTLHIPG